MKKKAVRRIIGIGIFHILLYVYVVPFVVYPKFGKTGFQFTLVVGAVISAAVLGTVFWEKKNKRRE